MHIPAEKIRSESLHSSALSDPAWFTQPAVTPKQKYWTLGVLAGLLILATFAFGAVHPWAYCLLQLLLLGLGLTFTVRRFNQLLNSTADYQVTLIKFPLTPWLICLVGWIALQLIPFPAGLVAWLSPQAAAIRELGTVNPPAWYPLSLNPFATRLELFRLLLAIAMIYLTLGVVKSSRGMVVLILIIAGLGLFEVILGASQLFEDPVRIWGWKTGSGGTRLSGTFINPDHMATFLEMAFFLTFGLFLGLTSEKKKTDEQSNWEGVVKKLIEQQSLEAGTKRMIVFFLALVLATGVILTQSRGGIIALIVALMTMSFMKRSQQKGQLPWAPLGFFLGSLAVYVWLVAGDVNMSRFGAIFDLEQEGVRLSLFKGTLAMAREFPWFGAGWGTFADVFPKYRTDIYLDKVADMAHSDWLQLLGEIGIIGFLLFVSGAVFYFLYIWKFLQKRRDTFAVGICLGCLGGILSAGFHAAVDFPMHIPANAMLVGVVLALAFLAVHWHRHPRGHFSYPVQKFQCGRRLALVFSGTLAGVLVLLAIPVWSHWGAESLVPSELDFTRTRPAYTVHDIKRAMAYSPGNPAYPAILAAKMNGSQLGNEDAKEKATPEIEKVIDLYKQAIQLSPAQWLYHLEYGWALIGTANPENLSPFRQGLQELETGTKLFPASGIVHFNYGMALLMAEKSFPEVIPPEKKGLGDKEIDLGITQEPDLAEAAEKLFQKVDNP